MDVIEQAKQRLRPNEGEFYKMWLQANKIQSHDTYRQYVLCDPIPRTEDQAHLDSIREARK